MTADDADSFAAALRVHVFHAVILPLCAQLVPSIFGGVVGEFDELLDHFVLSLGVQQRALFALRGGLDVVEGQSG